MVEQERGENTELTTRVLDLEQQVDDVSRTSDSKASSVTEMGNKIAELEKLLSEKATAEDDLAQQKKFTERLQYEIDELEAVKIELEDSRDMFDKEKQTRSQLERRFRDLEQQFEDQKIDHENIQQTMTSKVFKNILLFCLVL